MSFERMVNRKRREFQVIERSEILNALDDFWSGRPVIDRRFLVDIEWQKKVREELLGIIDSHTKDSPTRIFFIVGDYGSSKSQILAELEERLRSMLDTFTICHSCYESQKPEYINDEIIERKNEIFSIMSERKKEVLNSLREGKEISALIRNIMNLAKNFEGGVILLIDEFDYIFDENIPYWINFLVALNDKVRRGVLILIALTRDSLEKVSRDTRTERFLDIRSGRGIILLNGTYSPDNIIKAFAHFIAFYEKAYNFTFSNDALRLLHKISNEMKDVLGRNYSIRRANTMILSIIERMARIHRIRDVSREIYQLATQIRTSGLPSGMSKTEIEIGLVNCLKGERFEIVIDGEKKYVEVSGEKISLSVDGRNIESDGKLILLEKEGDVYTSSLEIPIEIKFVVRRERLSDEDVSKIIEFHKRRGILVFILGFANRDEIYRQLPELGEDQIIFIPEELALLVRYFTLPVDDSLKEEIANLLKISLDIETRIRRYISSEYEFLKFKPKLIRIIQELGIQRPPIQPASLVARRETRQEITPRQTTLSGTRVSPEVVARTLVELLGRKKRRLSTVIRSLTTVGLTREEAVGLLRYLSGKKHVLKIPEDLQETRYVSFKRNIDQEELASIINECGIL